MAQLRKIVLAGDSVLRQKAVTVRRFGDNLASLLDDMALTMYDVKGVGLAAPQVGISKRVIIVDDGDGLLELVNPEIISSHGMEEDYESCLSIPGREGKVPRAASIKVSAQDRQGKPLTLKAKDLLARILQHEMDHLNGRLFIDITTEEIKKT